MTSNLIALKGISLFDFNSTASDSLINVKCEFVLIHERIVNVKKLN